MFKTAMQKGVADMHVCSRGVADVYKLGGPGFESQRKIKKVEKS